MAARSSLKFCSAAIRNGLFRRTKVSPQASNATTFGPSTSKPGRFALPNRNTSRIPVELGGPLSLMPLHTVTASALFTSLLSLHNSKWGCLSEGFATPL